MLDSRETISSRGPNGLMHTAGKMRSQRPYRNDLEYEEFPVAVMRSD
jgi:hypothetical protein